MGIVYVRFSGDNPERLLTLISRSQLNFWGIKRFGSAIQVSVKPKDFKKLRKLRRGSGCKIHIAGRRGLPFILKRYRRRSGLCAGFILFLLINTVASMFIWNIQVEGNKILTEGEIKGMLTELGVSEGTFSRHVDCDTLRLRLAVMSDSISWASLTIDGSCLTVSVNEREAVEKTDTTPCNLIASRNGVVDEIHALSGVTKVKEGETVTKGQLLVSGVVEYSTGESRFLAAKGDVFALTTHNFSVTQPLKVTVTQHTGRQCRKSVLSFFGLNIPLYVGSVDFPYEKRIETHRLTTETAYLPVALTTATFLETTQAQVTLTQAAAEEKALEEMERLCYEADFELLEYDDSYTCDGREVTLNRHIIARENIAQKSVLEIDSANSD